MALLVDVLRWQPDAVEDAFRRFGQARDLLLNTDDELRAARPPAGWAGPAATAAGGRHEQVAEGLRRVVAGITALRPVLAGAADTIAAVRADLALAERIATERGYFINPDGTVLATPRAQREGGTQHGELVDLVQRALLRADELDDALAAALTEAAAGRVDDGTGDTLSGAASYVLGAPGAGLPPAGASPAEVARWWNALTPAQQEHVLLARPGAIGNLDGVPAGVRDEANRYRLDDEAARIATERAQVQSQLDAATAARPQVPFSVYGTTAEEDGLLARLADLDRQQTALGQITEVADLDGRRLLLLDLDSGSRPQAAVAVGDIDTADHVAVFTPGFTTTVGDLRGYTDDAAALRETAQQLADERGDGESVATVAWLGYDAPQWDTTFTADQSVAGDAAARAGGADLARFLDGVNASRVDDPHLTALGHSYGSTTTGYAVQLASGVDDAVLFGSPGGSTADLSQLNLPPGHLGVVEARWDPVADLGSFGGDPNNQDGVTNLSAQEEVGPGGVPLQESTGHSDYLTPGTTSQYNIAATVAGQPEHRYLDEGGIGFGDVLRGGPLPRGF